MSLITRRRLSRLEKRAASAVAEGHITPSEGAAISNMISGYSRALEVWDLSMRVEHLEETLKPKDEK